MNVLSLCAGIGGLDLGLERAGMTTVGQVEINEFCQRVLAKHWPEVPRHDDVRTTIRWWRSARRPPVDVVAAGFPCQPVSDAGLKLAHEDERWIWPDVADVIYAIKPQWVIAENVPGLHRRGLGTVLADLKRAGYRARTGVVSACAMGAPHPRERLFILAHTESEGRHPWGPERGSATSPHGQEQDRRGPRRRDWWATEPRVDGSPDGLSGWMDGARVDADAEEARADASLCDMRDTLAAQTVQRSIGGSQCFLETAVLRSGLHGCRLCQRHIAARIETQTGYQVPWHELRDVWGCGEPARPSHRRELGQRLAREHPDLVRVLSQHSPPPCSACWEDGSWEGDLDRVRYAAKDGVDRRRVLGNAVVPAVAEYIGRLVMASAGPELSEQDRREIAAETLADRTRDAAGEE